jgi:ribosomal protein S18 acetylase RimI-like enzyme
MPLGSNHHEYQLGASCFHVTPWQDDPSIALVVPTGSMQPNATDVTQLRAHLPPLGFTSAVTTALAPTAQQPFLENGFQHMASLALLVHNLETTSAKPVVPGLRIRRGSRRHLTSVLALDAKCFPPEWLFTESLLHDALRATPASRYRIASRDGPILGYAITGYTAGHGYLQRLAVEPAAQRQGIANQLVNDAIDWVKQNNGQDLTVNTMATNTSALDFYLHLGFLRATDGLDVLRIDLRTSSPPLQVTTTPGRDQS